MGYRGITFVKSVVFSYVTKISLLVTGIVYTYFVANYLGPENYGIVSYYIALIVSIINVCGIYFLQGILSVFIPKRKSKPFFLKVLKWQYCLAVILFLFVFVFAENIAMFLHKDEFLFLRYAAFLFLLLPLHDSLVFLFKGFKFFGKVLKVESIVSFLNLGLAFVFIVLLSCGIYGVIYARVVSYIVGILLLLLFFGCLRFRSGLFDMREVKSYSRGFFMVVLFKSASAFSFTLFVGMFLSSAMLGMFYLAQRITSYAVSSFQGSIAEVLLPFVVEDYKDKAFLNRYLSYSIKLSILLSLFSLVLLVLVGRPLLVILWPDYVWAYYLVIFYCVAASFKSFSVLNSAYMSQNRTDLLARVYLIDLVMTVIFSLIFMPVYGVYGAVATIMLIGIVHVFVSLHYLKRLGLNVDFVIRMNDIQFFFGLFRMLCGRMFAVLRGR